MKIFILCFILLSQTSRSQVIFDTIIKNEIYTSYFNFDLKQPVLICYKLYKGGGDCSRDSFFFKNDIKKIKTLSNKDYRNLNFDKGHLANSEDFAFNCKFDELTFRYYNCIPQTKELNRGIWKSYENSIRKLSQNDSLIILCYNTYSNKVVNSVRIADVCYKFVYSLSKKEFIMSFYCTNTQLPISKNISKLLIKRKYFWVNNYLKM